MFCKWPCTGTLATNDSFGRLISCALGFAIRLFELLESRFISLVFRSFKYCSFFKKFVKRVCFSFVLDSYIGIKKQNQKRIFLPPLDDLILLKDAIALLAWIAKKCTRVLGRFDY